MTKRTVDLGRCFVSFVVDALPMHYFQAELLLFSLQRFTSVRKENVLIHCTDRVANSFLDFLRDEGYAFQIVEPYLDRTFCNKLRQLDSFERIDANAFDGVLLLDADLFFLEDPVIGDKDCISGKTVDGPNPPLSILERIFFEAEITVPETVRTDWELRKGMTVKGNLNGGFYYVPAALAATVNHAWKKWAEWLFERPELFENQKQRNHVDQLSIALAIEEHRLPLHLLPSNCNCPIHSDQTLSLFEDERAVAVLHYHREIDRFGRIDASKVRRDEIVHAIQKANAAIAEMGNSRFYEAFRRSLLSETKPPELTEGSKRLLNEITALSNRRLKLILHAGTPKTGTTSLQFFLDEHRDTFLENGILYAAADGFSFAPKHQWIVQTLRNNNFESFLLQLKNALHKLDEQTHTILLSTEGIYNHWWDYSAEAKGFLHSLQSFFDVKIWSWFRDPVSFAESLYRQYLKNPRIVGIDCYGRDLGLDDMMEDDWFKMHLDYTGFLMECEALFGRDNVAAFGLTDDILEQVCNILDVSLSQKTKEKRNERLECVFIEVLRIFNRYEMPIDKKHKLVQTLYEMEDEFGAYFETRRICDGDEQNIKRHFTMQHDFLNKRYGLNLIVDKPSK